MIRLIAIIVTAASIGVVIYILFNKGQKPWEELTEAEQKKKKFILAGGLAVFVTGLFALLSASRKK